MKELLTNEEIDTLLDLFRSEGPPIEEAQSAALGEARAAGEGPVVSEVDLLKPNRFSRDQIRSLERLFESCAKALAATMGDRLRFEMICDCVAVEQLRFSAWMRTLTAPSVIYVLKMKPFEMPVLFTVTSSVLYGAVDRVLGGSGRVQASRNDFTAAEFTVADAFVGPCLDRVCSSLSDLGDLSWEISDRFCNPSMAQILPDQDVLLSVHFQVSSEFLLGDLRLVIPFSAIEPHLDRVEFGPGSMYRVPPGALRATTSETVQDVPVTLSVVLGEAQVALHQLLELQVGDVVALPTRVGEPLVAPVQGEPKFRGHVGRRGSQLAFQVASVMES